MTIFLISLLGACFFSYLAENGAAIDEYGEIRYKKAPIWALIIFLVVISGFRYMNYYQSDEYVYRVEVTSMIGKSLSQALARNQEWLYNITIWVCGNVFKSDQSFILLAAIVTNVSFVKFFERHSRNLTFVIFMYIVGGTYFTTMNVTRQYLAIAITIWAIELASEGRLFKYLLLVFVAAGFHSASWLMIPLYFVFRKHRWDATAVLITIGAAVVFLNFSSVLTSVLSTDNPYSHYLDGYANSYGVKLARILAWCVPYTFILLNRSSIIENQDATVQDVFCVLFSFLTSIISYKYVFVARVGAMFCAHTLCLMPIVPKTFGNSLEKPIKIAMILLFFAFGCYQMWGYQAYHNILFESISGVLY